MLSVSSVQDLAPDCAEIPIGCRWRRRSDEVSASRHRSWFSESYLFIWKKRQNCQPDWGVLDRSAAEAHTCHHFSHCRAQQPRTVLIVRVFICVFPGFGAEQEKKWITREIMQILHDSHNRSCWAGGTRARGFAWHFGKCIKMELLLRKHCTHRWVCNFGRLHKFSIFEIVCCLLSNSFKHFFASSFGSTSCY